MYINTYVCTYIWGFCLSSVYIVCVCVCVCVCLCVCGVCRCVCRCVSRCVCADTRTQTKTSTQGHGVQHTETDKDTLTHRQRQRLGQETETEKQTLVALFTWYDSNTRALWQVFLLCTKTHGFERWQQLFARTLFYFFFSYVPRHTVLRDDSNSSHEVNRRHQIQRLYMIQTQRHVT